jgi:uncharacterized Fe-S cluster-containing MiaB family protein
MTSLGDSFVRLATKGDSPSMHDPSRNPIVGLGRKSLPLVSRSGVAASAFRTLLATRGEICPATRHLPVPVRIVVDQSRLAPLSGRVNPCNRNGNAGHDPRQPLFFWFQHTPVGRELYLVLYTRRCEWARCSFCTLPSESAPVDVAEAHIVLQARAAFDALTAEQAGQVRRLFLSNNGSVLSPTTMPVAALLEIMQLAHERCPALEIVCLETRFETVSAAKIRTLQRHFAEWHRLYGANPGGRQAPEPVILQFSAGYETQDPYLRNAVLWKGYPEDKVQSFFALIARAQRESGQPVFVDEYVMLKPAAGLSDEGGIAEAVETIVHLASLGRHFGVDVSVRLNPTFAALGSELYLQFTEDRYRPPTFHDLYQVLERCRAAGVSIPIFIGLNNEGLTLSPASFGNGDETDRSFHAALQAYNAHQDFSRLTREIRDSSLSPLAAEPRTFPSTAR